MGKKILFKQSNGLISVTWLHRKQPGCTDTNNGECSGCPNLTVVLENTKKTPHTCFG